MDFHNFDLTYLKELQTWARSCPLESPTSSYAAILFGEALGQRRQEYSVCCETELLHLYYPVDDSRGKPDVVLFRNCPDTGLPLHIKLIGICKNQDEDLREGIAKLRRYLKMAKGQYGVLMTTNVARIYVYNPVNNEMAQLGGDIDLYCDEEVFTSDSAFHRLGCRLVVDFQVTVLTPNRTTPPHRMGSHFSRRLHNKGCKTVHSIRGSSYVTVLISSGPPLIPACSPQSVCSSLAGHILLCVNFSWSCQYSETLCVAR